ncbi:interleukin-12 receptor subunit beta-1 [Cyanistes caeruleus]|uniref:interleukin-12 receptor subunit beta-1 n=1 Tax=Cyanistes caeruleus TaxID=156563 RepID=UPI000CDAC81E|nr:interleukin-12 receptor subunit beta-1 [Cyanistes caeruleus]XP_023798725.1 interleukin-12 receptor subunit beta-1 [Cyanistes caeruleus]XP_023798726.1 interleukin-12 receptor subunit beta-1 [Cyanistes caeruleus]XP_023798727.1 interleukin-12 receptor subunit beta-1 [Cyanistes caeruleus]
MRQGRGRRSSSVCPQSSAQVPAALEMLSSPGSPQGVIFSSYPDFPPFHPRSQVQGDQRGRQHRDCAVGSAGPWRCLLLRAADAAGASETGNLLPAGIPCPQHPRAERQGSAPSPSLSPHPGSEGLSSTPGSSPGALGAPGCHRLAVHGRDTERGWATFALWHRYSSNDSLLVPVNISSGDAAVVLRWKPSPRAACPGALDKYLVCHEAEGDNASYSEVDATASNYTLQNLQPGTAYRVGVWEVTEDSERTCSAWWHFQTKGLGPRGAAWRSNLNYLGISLGVPAAAAIYHLSKKRARRLLFPPLPKPVGTKAIQFSADEMSQGQPRTGLLEPSERFSPAELLLTEPNPSEEKPDTATESAVLLPEVSQAGPALETPAAAVASPQGCGEELPFAYRRQDTLSPGGSPASGSSTGHPPGEEEEEEEEGRQGMHQPLIPIALLISDKPIIIRDEEGWDPVP